MNTFASSVLCVVIHLLHSAVFGLGGIAFLGSFWFKASIFSCLIVRLSWAVPLTVTVFVYSFTSMSHGEYLSNVSSAFYLIEMH